MTTKGDAQSEMVEEQKQQGALRETEGLPEQVGGGAWKKGTGIRDWIGTVTQLTAVAVFAAYLAGYLTLQAIYAPLGYVPTGEFRSRYLAIGGAWLVTSCLCAMVGVAAVTLAARLWPSLVAQRNGGREPARRLAPGKGTRTGVASFAGHKRTLPEDTLYLFLMLMGATALANLAVFWETGVPMLRLPIGRMSGMSAGLPREAWASLLCSGMAGAVVACGWLERDYRRAPVLPFAGILTTVLVLVSMLSFRYLYLTAPSVTGALGYPAIVTLTDAQGNDPQTIDCLVMDQTPSSYVLFAGSPARDIREYPEGIVRLRGNVLELSRDQVRDVRYYPWQCDTSERLVKFYTRLMPLTYKECVPTRKEGTAPPGDRYLHAPGQ